MVGDYPMARVRWAHPSNYRIANRQRISMIVIHSPTAIRAPSLSPTCGARRTMGRVHISSSVKTAT